MALVLRSRQAQPLPGDVVNGNTVIAKDGRDVHFVCRHGVNFSRWYAPKKFGATRCPCDHKVMSNNFKHGATGSTEYAAWRNMKTRCYNKNFVDWEIYGGRGVTICDRWMTSFDAFLADMGKRPGPGYSLDRIDSDKGYEPGNCRWATATEQARNRRYCISLTFDGQTRLLSEWADITGFGRKTIHDRIYRRGWSIDRALTYKPTNRRPR